MRVKKFFSYIYYIFILSGKMKKNVFWRGFNRHLKKSETKNHHYIQKLVSKYPVLVLSKFVMVNKIFVVDN